MALVEPSLAIGDRALDLGAIRQVWPTTQEQRCWVPRQATCWISTAEHSPRSRQPYRGLRNRDQDHQKAFDLFCVKTYEAKYPKAVECLVKDRGLLLTFYDFPAEHWRHIRTTNPIESTFATMRLRTVKTKGSGSRMACLTMVFKLMESASRSWRLLNKSSHLQAVISGAKFVDGIEVQNAALLKPHPQQLTIAPMYHEFLSSASF